MWEWYVSYSLWFLIISAVLCLLFLLCYEKIRKLFSLTLPRDKRDAATGRVNVFYWILSSVFLAVLIVSFVVTMFFSDGNAPVITVDSLKQWALDKGVAIFITLVIGIVLWLVLRRLMSSLVNTFMAKPPKGESREGSKRRANTLVNVFVGLGRAIILLIVVLTVLSELDIAVGPLLAGLGVVGIAVGFGAQYLIRDLIAGTFILMENQYRIGDVAKVADVTGTVEKIDLRKTVVRDIDGVVHYIPNGEIRVASNYSRHFSRVNLNISVAYNTDLDYAIKVINRVCKEMAQEERWKAVIRTVPAVLRVHNLGDSGIDIKILGDVKPLEQWNVMGELRLRIKKEFDKVGIEIPYPHLTVYLNDESVKQSTPARRGR
jgi:small-conductance mechanosensitive channel